MGSGTIGYKKLPRKQKVYGDKNFYIYPITYGFGEDKFECIVIRPAANKKEYNFEIEGEFSMSPSYFEETKEEYRGVDVKYAYFKNEEHLFTPEQLEEVKQYCDKVI